METSINKHWQNPADFLIEQKDTAVMQYDIVSMLGNRDAKSTGGKKYETLKNEDILYYCSPLLKIEIVM